MYEKLFDTVWIDGLLYKLLNELVIKGRMWPTIKDLRNNVKAHVQYSCTLSSPENSISHRIMAREDYWQPLSVKVYKNSLLRTLSDHSLAISINALCLPATLFAHDVTLIAQFPSCLATFMNICYQYIVYLGDTNSVKSK